MENIEKVADKLHDCRRIFFVTGAGISSESGLPTYRGIGGLYETTATEEGVPIETVLSGEMMESNPDMTWKYLNLMEKACRSATFNRAHKVIAEMEDTFESVCVLTQNIDGFHRAAGSRNVIDIHGDIHDIVCPGCGYRIEVEDFSGFDIPPLCPECTKVLRPDVVLFGETLPGNKCEKLMKEWEKGFDIVFSVGTTSVFPYISQPVLYARHNGIPTVEINPGETGVTYAVDIKISGKAAETLDEMWKRYN
ncbi:NAD-dependent deacetylase [Candidatus Latescibacterota bacterium]